jgi:hypothetical protein
VSGGVEGGFFLREKPLNCNDLTLQQLENRDSWLGRAHLSVSGRLGPILNMRCVFFAHRKSTNSFAINDFWGRMVWQEECTLNEQFFR